MDAVVGVAILALRTPLKRFPGQVFAQNGPQGFFVADGIVGGDELPFSGAAPKAIVAASGLKSRSKRDATRDESRRELVPKKMRERVD